MKISPSILNADYLNLDKDIKVLESAGADMLHIDVMDGRFVPNISFGVPVIKSIYNHTKLPLDVHLMVEGNTTADLGAFCEYAEYVTLHVEAGFNLQKEFAEIKRRGCKPAISINPSTKIEEIYPYLELVDMVLVMSVQPGFGGQKFNNSIPEKIKALSQEIKRRNLKVEIEVDGGINAETAVVCANAGATVLVAGNYLFNSSDIKKAVQNLKKL